MGVEIEIPRSDEEFTEEEKKEIEELMEAYSEPPLYILKGEQPTE